MVHLGNDTVHFGRGANAMQLIQHDRFSRGFEISQKRMVSREINLALSGRRRIVLRVKIFSRQQNHHAVRVRRLRNRFCEPFEKIA